MNVLTICTINQIFAITVGILSNSLLLWLICTASTHNLRSYTRILKLHCISDLFYILILEMTSLRLVSHGKDMIIIITGILSTIPYASMLTILSVFGFILELALIQIDYYYRYILVCRNHTFSNRRFAICVLLALTVSCWQSCVSFYAMDFGPSRDPAINKYWKIAKESLGIGNKVYPYSVVNGESPRMWLSELSTMTIIIVVYGIVIFSTVKIRQTLRDNARRRAKKESKRTAIQITRVMVMQAISPFISFALPVILVTLGSFVNLNTKSVGIWMTLNLFWSPSIKSIATIYIVTPYRRAFLKKFAPRFAPPPSATTSKDDSLVRTQSHQLQASSNNELSNNQVSL